MAYTNINAGCLVAQRDGIKNVFPVKAGLTLYDGSVAIINNGTATYNPTANDTFVGVIGETGDKTVPVYATGVYKFKCAGLNASAVGKIAYLETGTSGNPATVTVTKPATAGSIILAVGIITAVAVNGAECDVRIDGFACREQAEAAS